MNLPKEFEEYGKQVVEFTKKIYPKLKGRVK